MSDPVCPYCGASAEFVTGAVIYPHRPDLAEKTFWRCAPCEAWVGCHPGESTPLGSLANGPLRRARGRAHGAFDELWKGRHMARGEAYAALSEALGIEPQKTHIGHFDEATCDRVVEAVKGIRAKLAASVGPHGPKRVFRRG